MTTGHETCVHGCHVVVAGLPPRMTAANFGKLVHLRQGDESPNPEDIARALLQLVVQASCIVAKQFAMVRFTGFACPFILVSLYCATSGSSLTTPPALPLSRRCCRRLMRKLTSKIPRESRCRSHASFDKLGQILR